MYRQQRQQQQGQEGWRPLQQQRGFKAGCGEQERGPCLTGQAVGVKATG